MSGSDGFDDGSGGGFFSKIKKNSIPAMGTLVFLTVGAIGAYRYKTRGTKFSTSVFLLQLRVAAQGTVIALLGGIMVYHMVDDYILKEKKK